MSKQTNTKQEENSLKKDLFNIIVLPFFVPPVSLFTVSFIIYTIMKIVKAFEIGSFKIILNYIPNALLILAGMWVIGIISALAEDKPTGGYISSPTECNKGLFEELFTNPAYYNIISNAAKEYDREVELGLRDSD